MKTGKRILMLLVLVLSLAFAGCAKRSEYYIEKPKDSKFMMDKVDLLSDSDVELIKEFVPEVTEWYNSIDIGKAQPVDFVTEEINNLGDKLYESPAWTTYLENQYSTEDVLGKYQNVAEFKQISKANIIYGDIAGIMMESEMDFALSEDSDATITISEEKWVELGDSIKKAIAYYYE